MKKLLPAALLAALGCFSKEGDSVALMTSAIPPIDAAAPAKVETVAFAVG
ncbi:MAG TPA: hypothetical protein VNM14_07495 [Planctomycetota bacterium]|nr:hypothetical protein [Planctomycetota bacterium]